MTYTREEFVKKYSPFVNGVVKRTGILTGTVLSQAIIESQGKVDGTYKVGGSKLAREANNYFGIKATPSWKGKVYNIETGEYTPSGTYYTTKSDFRAYPTVKDSIRDYVKFLLENPRYKQAGVFEAKSVEEQAEALKRAGYATSPTYARMIADVHHGINQWISSKVEAGVKFAKEYWVAIGISAIGLAGLIYVFVKLKK